MAQPRTVFKCFGRLAKDPDPIHSKKNNKMYVELGVYHNPGRNQKSVYIEFFIYDTAVSEYVLENFRKGDQIYIVEATPTTRMGDDFGKYKFICWNVALKEYVEKRTKKMTSFKGGDDGDTDEDI